MAAALAGSPPRSLRVGPTTGPESSSKSSSSLNHSSSSWAGGVRRRRRRRRIKGNNLRIIKLRMMTKVRMMTRKRMRLVVTSSSCLSSLRNLLACGPWAALCTILFYPNSNTDWAI